MSFIYDSHIDMVSLLYLEKILLMLVNENMSDTTIILAESYRMMPMSLFIRFLQYKVCVHFLVLVLFEFIEVIYI